MQDLKMRYEKTVLKALSISIDKADKETCEVSLVVDDRHLQPMGIVHGGIYALMAESAASIGAYYNLTEEDSGVVGIEINANHLKSIREGRIIAKANKIHGGKTTLVYETKIYDEKENLVSISRMTLLKLKRK